MQQMNSQYIFINLLGGKDRDTTIFPIHSKIFLWINVSNMTRKISRSYIQNTIAKIKKINVVDYTQLILFQLKKLNQFQVEREFNILE